jgi:hypothetical protein
VSECSFSTELELWLRADGPKTVGSLSAVFAEKSFAVTILVLMFVPALPAPTGGITHLFELATMGLGAQMMVGRRTLWAPVRWQRRDLGALATERTIPFMIRRIRSIERLSRPRLAWVFRGSLGWRLVGVLVFGFALAAALAPPFTGLDTLPSMGAMIVALAIVLEDAAVLAVGVAVGTVGVGLVVTAGAVAWHFARRLL